MHDDADARAIAATALQNGGAHDALLSIAQGESIGAFRTRALLSGVARSSTLGMSARELTEYSLTRAIREISLGERRAFASSRSLEAEIHHELVKRFGDPDGDGTLLVPTDFLARYVRRDLNTSTGGAGGFLVDTSATVFGPIQLATPQSMVLAFGAQNLEGLRDNISITTVATGPTVEAVPSQTSGPSESTPTFKQVALEPHMVGATFDVSGKLLLQTSPGAQQFLTNLLLTAFAAKLDALALNGSGVSGEPIGALQVSGIGSVSGTSLALTGVLGLQSATGNRLSARGGYCTTAAVATTLATREKSSGSGQMLWTGNLFTGNLGGFPARSTANMPADALLFGNWNNMLIAGWGALAVEVNRFANFASNIVTLRVLHGIDIALLDPAAFSAATSIS